MPNFPPIAYHLFDIPASNLIFPVRMCNLACVCDGVYQYYCSSSYGR